MLIEIVIGTEWKKIWGGQNSPLVEEKLWSPYSQSKPHAVHGWKWPHYFLKDFVKCLRSKALRCTHCWRRKARAGWEAADGEVALNHPQDWCHLMPAPWGLFCHSKASGLQCAVCSLFSYFFNLLLWPLLYPQAVASGGGGGPEKRKSEIFDKEPLCCSIHGGYARAHMHTSLGSEYCLNAFWTFRFSFWNLYGCLILCLCLCTN